MRVVRVYHGARDPAHRVRDEALLRAGVDLRLVLPAQWSGPSDVVAAPDGLDLVELDVVRPGDVNRHRYADLEALREAVLGFRPDVVDVHEEPVSVVARQVLRLVEREPVVMYSAQNLDKRWPPPFGSYERAALARVSAFYPCSRQAASVLRGKGSAALVRVLPLGVDPGAHYPGKQDLDDPELVLGFVGRLMPYKGLLDAVEVLARLGVRRPTRLLVVGEGPEAEAGRRRAEQLGVSGSVEWHTWATATELGTLYRRMHVVLVPSRATPTWVEQFGRVITEGAANGAVPVGYASGSIPEVVADTGVVIPEDVDHLVAAVEALSADPDRWRVLRERGLHRSEELSWEQVARGQAELYEAVTARARDARPPTGRGAARQEFGAPASTSVSDRPLALPYLRTSRWAHRLLR